MNKKTKKIILYSGVTTSILALPFLLSDNFHINYNHNLDMVEKYRVNDEPIIKNGNYQKVNIPPKNSAEFDVTKFNFTLKTPGWSNWAFGDEKEDYPKKEHKHSQTVAFDYSILNNYIISNSDSVRNLVKFSFSQKNTIINSDYFGGRLHDGDWKSSGNMTINKGVTGLLKTFKESELASSKLYKNGADAINLNVLMNIKNNFDDNLLNLNLSRNDVLNDSFGWHPTEGVYFWEYNHLISSLGSSSLQLIMPYTHQDVAGFKKELEDVIAKPITFYSDDIKVFSEKNFKTIKTTIENRIANFYENDYIQSTKIGSINASTTDFSYLTPPASQSDNTLEAKHKVKFSLKNNDVFLGTTGPGGEKLFPNGNSLDMTINIKIMPGSTGTYNPKELIKIDPYRVSELNDNYFVKPGEINDHKLSQSTLGSQFENFSVNLNTKQSDGDYSLMPKDKIPLVMRYGLKLNFDLILKDSSGIEITKNIDVFYLYNNDSTKISVDFSTAGSPPQIFNFILKLRDNKILIENDGVNKWSSPNSSTLSISNVSSYLPSDQNTKVAKWVVVSQDKDNNIDTYKTEEPFKFKMPFVKRVGSTAARFVPFVNGEIPGLSPNTGMFELDLGPFILAQKKGGEKINVTIEIKEYDPGTQSYSKLAYTLIVNVELNDVPLLFELNGWKSPALSEEDKKKYFNSESEDKTNYRGDFVSEETGMYIPKVAWVNSMPPKTFLYDPLDADGEKLDGIGDDESSDSIVKYDIGYLAQINAPGFKDGDFESMPTIGGYTIQYPPEYTADGKYPYTESYDFSNSGTFPNIIHESLTNNGMVFANKELRQTILKKNNSDSFIYQFSIISPDKIEKNLFTLYESFKTVKNEQVFVDFWDTYHGANLLSYLQGASIIESMEAARDLEFEMVNSYWGMYVNEMTSISPSDGKTDLNKISFQNIFLQIENINLLGPEVKKKIEEEINNRISKPSNITLKLNIDYTLDDDFDEKIKILASNFDLEDPSKAGVSFGIHATPSSKHIKNSGTINVINTKYQPFDLSKINGEDVLFNSSDPNNRPKDIFNWIKNDLIGTLVHNEITSETRDNSLILNKDYQFKFYTEKINTTTGSVTKINFKDIDDAINNCLLANVDNKDFDNNLFVEVYASNTLESYKLQNSYVKKYNNSNKNKNPIIEQRIYDLSIITNMKPLKFNTESINFPAISNKEEFLLGYINDYVGMTISNFIYHFNSLETRQAINLKDYTIVSAADESKTLEDIIKDFLIISDPLDFDISIDLKIKAIQPSKILKNSYNLTINNSSKNPGLPVLPEIDEEDDIIDKTPPTIDDENIFKPISGDGDFWTQNNWWIITVISISALLIITTGILVKVRRNRNIR